MLGLGSTLGIVVQFLILLPFLRRAGFHYRPRFDFRGTGLGHTARLGVWTVLFVVVNQLAYLVVTRLASSGTVKGGGTGNTVYSSSFLIMMVPHAIVTVSLTTAILPRLSGYATDERRADMGSTLGSTLRTALVVVLPFAALVPIVARDIAGVLFDAGAGDPAAFAPTLAVFGPALVFFTVHYMMLRGFYALEQTRLVFFIQCAISATNIAVAVWLVGRATRRPDRAGARAGLAGVVRRGLGDQLRRAAPDPGRPADPGAGALPGADGAGLRPRRRGRLVGRAGPGRAGRGAGDPAVAAARRARRARGRARPARSRHA